MATRYVSDTARANWSSLLSALLGVGFASWLLAARGALASVEPLTFLINVYLFMWPSFGVVYLLWTHLAYSKPGPRSLSSRARRESELRGRWWSSIIGYGGPSSWTLTAAIVAIFLTVIVAQSPAYRSDLIYIGLSLMGVACSWALMVYSFALQYLRLDAEAGETRHIEIGLDEDARFGDYLTLAILLSTMAATVSATIHSRQAWLVVRTNVLFAFTFNSVIVAMVVSLLIGGLVG